MNVPQDEQTFLITFNLIKKQCLAIWVVCDIEHYIITTEMVLLSLSLQDCGWSSPMLRCSVSGHGVWQKPVIFQNIGRCPQLALVYFLSLQSTHGQSFAFPDKSKLRNALLHSRSGCLQIQTLSSAAFLSITLTTVYDKSWLILYCSQHPCEHIQWPPNRKRLKRKAVRRRWLQRKLRRKSLRSMNEVCEWLKLQDFIRSLYLHLIYKGGEEKGRGTPHFKCD